MPNKYQNNIIQDQFNELDTLGSYFNAQNYTTLYVAPSPTHFDRSDSWVYRGSKCLRHCQQVGHFPLEFEKIVVSTPSPDYVRNVLAEEPMDRIASNYYFVPDRITSAEFIEEFRALKCESSKPVFGFYFTEDTHHPFMGADSQHHYSQYLEGAGLTGMTNENTIYDEYVTLSRYTDAHLGKIIDFLRAEYPDTILVVTGDHGARSAPGFESYDKRTASNSWKSCAFNANGHALLYDVGATIAYLGEDPFYKDYFEELRNKTVNYPVSHSDLARTIQELVELSHKPLPSARQGQNLIVLGKDLLNNRDTERLQRRASISYTDLYSELRRGNETFKFFTDWKSSVDRYNKLNCSDTAPAENASQIVAQF